MAKTSNNQRFEITSMSTQSPSNAELLIILFSICFLNVNNFFGYHSPSAISETYQNDYKLNNTQFGTLFTIYSAPNVVLVFFAGMFIDKYGIEKASYTFNILILIGFLLCALAPIPSENISTHFTYAILLTGRLFIGLGGESICAAASTMLTKWFTKTGHINTAVATNQSIVQLFGSSLAFYLLPRFHSLSLSQWFTVFVGVFSLLANILYCYYEHKYSIYVNYLHTCTTDCATSDSDPVTEYSDSKIVSSTTAPVHHTNCSAHSNNNENSKLLTNTIADMPDIADKSLTIYETLELFPLMFWLLLLHVVRKVSK